MASNMIPRLDMEDLRVQRSVKHVTANLNRMWPELQDRGLDTRVQPTLVPNITGVHVVPLDHPRFDGVVLPVSQHRQSAEGLHMTMEASSEARSMVPKLVGLDYNLIIAEEYPKRFTPLIRRTGYFPPPELKFAPPAGVRQKASRTGNNGMAALTWAARIGVGILAIPVLAMGVAFVGTAAAVAGAATAVSADPALFATIGDIDDSYGVTALIFITAWDVDIEE